MEFYKRNKLIIRTINVSIILALAIMVLAIGIMAKDDWVKPKTDYSESLKAGWTVINKDGTEKEVSENFKIGKSEPVTFYRTLPSYIEDDQVLSLKCSYYSVDAFIDGEHIYHAGPAKIKHITTTLGNVFVFIPLKSEYEGKKITITVNPRHYGFEIFVKDIMITTMADYSFMRIKKSVPYFVLGMALLVIAIASLVLFATLGNSRKGEQYFLSKGFLNLGFFNICAVCWIISDFHIFGMITGRMVLSGIVSYVAFMLCPFMFAGVFLSIFEKNFYFKMVFLVSELNFVIQMTLFITGVIDLPQGIIVSQLVILLLVGGMIYFGVFIVKNFGKRNAILLVLPTLCFVIFSFIAIVAYILNKEWMLYVALALTFFAFTVVDYLLIHLVEALKANTKLEEVKKYAYFDNLTSLENRRAYDEYITYLNDRIKEGGLDANISTIMLDLNGLKKTNDTFGHAAGDELIVGSANCIRNIFGKKGRCFRTGGDEFVVIVSIEHEEFLRRYDELEKALASFKGKYVEGISISVGKADRNEFPQYTIEKLLNVADKRMYENKQHYHTSQLKLDEGLFGDEKNVRNKLRKKSFLKNFSLNKYTMPVIRQMAEVIPGGFFIYREDETRELIYQNRKVLELFGCDTLAEFKQLTGYTFEGMVHPSDFEIIQNSIDKQIDAEYSDGMDHVIYRIIRKDGSVRVMDDYGHFSHSEDYGDIYYVFINDITDVSYDRSFMK